MDPASDPNLGAAHCAQELQSNTKVQSEKPRGLLTRLLGPIGAYGNDHNGAVRQSPTSPNADPNWINPFRTNNPPVSDIAVPKAEIVAVPIDMELDELVEVFRQSGRTRLPVFEGTLDDPKGFIHLKDLALEHGFNGTAGEFSLRKVTLHKVLSIAQSMRVDVLLEMMRSKRTHMALVIDEYGGVDGLVTIEDLVEVIFGEISDEHDDEDDEKMLVEEGDGSFFCRSRLPLSDLEQKLGRSLKVDGVQEDSDTLGGLVFVLAGRVPVTGEVIRDAAANLEFEIVSADPRRIRDIRVRQGTDSAI